MAGSSGTPLATKLGVRPGDTLALLRAPDGLTIELPDGVSVKHRVGGRADVVVEFATRRRDVEPRLDRLAAMVHPAGGLWIAWPKRSSGVATDLSDHTVRDLALDRGLVDNKVCAIDEVWTGLRLVWRLHRR